MSLWAWPSGASTNPREEAAELQAQGAKLGLPVSSSTFAGQTGTQKFKNFEDMVANCDVPLLVDWNAVWCGPCQMMSGALKDVGATFGDRLKIVKIDVDKYQNLASKHRIQGLPTLMLFKQGKPVDRIEGFLPASDLIMRIGKQV
eukprot:jgi/Astpho2/1070/Aster-x0981